MSKEKEVSVETAPELLPTTANTTDLVEVTSEGTPPAFEVVKSVTRPVLKFGISPEYIHIESPMRTGEKMEGAKIKELPTLMDVINLKTGEAHIIVALPLPGMFFALSISMPPPPSLFPARYNHIIPYDTI